MLAPFFLFFTSVSSLNRCFSILTIAFVIAAGSPRRQPVAVSRNAWLFPYGSGFTGPNLLWGVPQSIVTFNVCNCSAAPTCFNHSAVLPTSESTSFSRLSRSVLHKSDPPLSPTCVGSGLSLKPHILLLSPPPRCISLALKRRSKPTLLSPPGLSRLYANRRDSPLYSPVTGLVRIRSFLFWAVIILFWAL
ncbi:hypothetical protein Bca52824_035805 [Brassica carinata]|uniref:Uncharacterized protein n=1 Tax=Brassica carinata TaxID=52824 RepID=A0A8X7S1E5_BRACI|nr:hypothetical protein Bca52824_035805 [Brassica carinata]